MLYIERAKHTSLTQGLLRRISMDYMRTQGSSISSFYLTKGNMPCSII